MTQDRFASRIDALNLVTLLVTLALAVPVFRVAATGVPWVGVFYGVVLVAVIWLYASTYYVVTDDELLVRSAWCVARSRSARSAGWEPRATRRPRRRCRCAASKSSSRAGRC